jgi:5-formyltetrahydrofolate cyclo-ligase
MTDRMKKQRFFINSKHIAVYIPMQGEISPLALVHLAWQMGKAVYLPILMPFLENRLWFAPWNADSKMQTNRYGIPEPVNQGRHIIPASHLDLVITPLVAFDKHCHRVGMGGGYYDRTFTFLRFRQHWHSPKLIGIAYEFQKITNISTQTWDVPLHAVVTENKIYKK